MKTMLIWGILVLFTCPIFSQCPPLKEALKNPKAVSSLDLTGCNIRTFPSEVFKLKNLTALHMGPKRLIMYRSDAGSPVAGNLFKMLPDNFGKLKGLKVLNLQATDLRSLPLSFTKLQALRELDLSFNPRLDSAVLFEILPQITNLAKLNLTGCNLSKESRIHLEKILPETTCIFDKTQIIARDK